MNYLRKPVVLHVLKSLIYSGAEHVVVTIIKGRQRENLSNERITKV